MLEETLSKKVSKRKPGPDVDMPKPKLQKTGAPKAVTDLLPGNADDVG